MSRKDTSEVNTAQKVQTKYDRKMEARKQQKIKEQREENKSRNSGYWDWTCCGCYNFCSCFFYQ